MTAIACGNNQRQEIICYDAQQLKKQQWRIKTIATLQKQMKQLNTKNDPKNTICYAISEWFVTGHVPLYKYPEKSNEAII